MLVNPVEALGRSGGSVVWEGPPVGQFGTPPASATDQTQTYRIDQIIENIHRVPSGVFQEFTDQLAWIANQRLLRIPIGHRPWIWAANTDKWRWPLPQHEHPDAWGTIPRRKLWQRGFVEAVPDASE